MIKTTRWRPDTCDCVIEYEWDDTVPAESRTHTFARHPKRCSAHSGLDGSPVLDVVLDENRRKNHTRAAFLSELGAVLGQTYTDESGSQYFDFKGGVTVNWSWSGTGADRVLQVSVSGYTLTAQQKAKVQAFADNRFGVGKVVIV